jgi:hypothetical protein
MKFKTASGSQYEINTETKQIRRLSGNADPTGRQGKDGDWRGYASVFPDPIEVGSSVVICWGADTPLLPETIAIYGEGSAIPTTTTSAVVSVE